MFVFYFADACLFAGVRALHKARGGTARRYQRLRAIQAHLSLRQGGSFLKHAELLSRLHITDFIVHLTKQAFILSDILLDAHLLAN